MGTVFSNARCVAWCVSTQVIKRTVHCAHVYVDSETTTQRASAEDAMRDASRGNRRLWGFWLALRGIRRSVGGRPVLRTNQ